eukprot:CAMPEP_0206542802 /NCGR_PEP_ID=MMETSP0325_2-20121206/10410_1 /ASSEMBLY_ACC=CAM_ASM_000347 /TAXON_ID=2866 /ORGANISM="Crypthecodinium cohnii, Strain Seligo" /LENGTH=177 /DNA_ID=CAMNT_0054040971 /DNA_START=127 /DNA_END=660 /DNA_ORIENTATION=-
MASSASINGLPAINKCFNFGIDRRTSNGFGVSIMFRDKSNLVKAELPSSCQGPSMPCMRLSDRFNSTREGSSPRPLMSSIALCETSSFCKEGKFAIPARVFILLDDKFKLSMDSWPPNSSQETISLFWNETTFRDLNGSGLSSVIEFRSNKRCVREGNTSSSGVEALQIGHAIGREV